MIQLLTIAILIMTFIFEAISHGLQYQIRYLSLSHSKIKKYGKLWHTYNTLFIAFLSIGVLLQYTEELSRYSLDNSYIFTYDMYLDWLMVGGLVAVFRFCIFAPVRNIVADKPITYVGSTANGDGFYSEYIIKWFPPYFLLLLRITVFATISITLMS